MPRSLTSVLGGAGLRITTQYGNFYESPASDMEFGTVDADKALGKDGDHGVGELLGAPLPDVCATVW